MADINNNSIPEDILTTSNGEHCKTRNAKKVVGTTDLGVCERIATEGTLANVYLYLQYIYGVVSNYLVYLLTISDTATLIQEDLTSVIVEDIDKTGGRHKAMLTAGVGHFNESVIFSAEKTELALLERDDVYNNGGNNYEASLNDILTTTPYVQNITRRTNGRNNDTIAITHIFAQLDLHTDDASNDFNIRAIVRLWNEEYGIYQIVADYSFHNFKGPQPNSHISEDFDIPFIGKWNGDDGRFGYIEFTSPTNTTPSYSSSMRINLKSYQFISPRP